MLRVDPGLADSISSADGVPPHVTADAEASGGLAHGRSTAAGKQPYALPRIGVDPMARRERYTPVVFFEFRPAGFVPRYRRGLPHQQEKLVHMAGIDAAAEHSRRGRALVPRHDRTDRVRRNLFHLARNQRPARLARTADHFRDGRNRPGRAGRSRGSLFRQTASADGIPLRSDRIASRHLRVHGAELSASAVGGLGFHRFHPLSGVGQLRPAGL